MNNITVLAPSKDALKAFLNMNSTKALVQADAGVVRAVLSYHVLNGTYSANDIPDNASIFVPTLLINQTYTNVTGGQVVEALRDGNNVSFYSGLRDKSMVERADLNFTGGVVHIIDRVLRIPVNLTGTAILANLSAVDGALTATNLSTRVSDLKNVTVFAPNNGAFAKIASALRNLSTSDLQNVLQYHVVQGTVGYSSDLKNGSLKTVEGSSVHIAVDNGTVYVNKAKILIPNVLMANGVVHVIDNVLNPNNTKGANPSNTEPAFPGATSASDVPFTSGVPQATSGAATGLETATSTEAAPRATGALVMGALLGGAALLANGL